MLGTYWVGPSLQVVFCYLVTQGSAVSVFCFGKILALYSDHRYLFQIGDLFYRTMFESQFLFLLIFLLKLGSPVTSVCVLCVPRAVSTYWAGSWGHWENMPTPGVGHCAMCGVRMLHREKLWHICYGWVCVPQSSVIQVWLPEWGSWELVEPSRGGAQWDVFRSLETCPGRGYGTLVPTFLCFSVSQPRGEQCYCQLLPP